MYTYILFLTILYCFYQSINIWTDLTPLYGSRINASIFSFITSLLSIYYILTNTNESSATLISIICFSYLITDTCHHTINSTLTKQDIVHHLMMAIAITTSYNLGHYWYLILGTTSEISTPFLHYCYYCKMEYKTKHSSFIASSIMLITSYFIFRILNFSYIVYTSWNADVTSIYTSMGILLILNIYWFVLLLRIAIKVLYIK